MDAAAQPVTADRIRLARVVHVGRAVAALSRRRRTHAALLAVVLTAASACAPSGSTRSEGEVSTRPEGVRRVLAHVRGIT